MIFICANSYLTMVQMFTRLVEILGIRLVGSMFSLLFRQFTSTVLTDRLISPPLEAANVFLGSTWRPPESECRRLLLNAGADSTRYALAMAVKDGDTVCAKKT